MNLPRNSKRQRCKVFVLKKLQLIVLHRMLFITKSLNSLQVREADSFSRCPAIWHIRYHTSGGNLLARIFFSWVGISCDWDCNCGWGGCSIDGSCFLRFLPLVFDAPLERRFCIFCFADHNKERSGSFLAAFYASLLLSFRGRIRIKEKGRKSRWMGVFIEAWLQLNK